MTDQSAIVASYRWTLNEFLEAQGMHYDLFVKPKLKFAGFIDIRIPAVILVCGLTLRIAIDLSEGAAFEAGELIYVLGVFVGTLILLQPWLRKRALIRHFHQRPDRDKQMQFRITPEQVAIFTEGISSASNQWNSYHRIIGTRKGYLLYPNDWMFQWLPNHAFANKDDIELFAGLAKQHSRDYSERH